MAYIVDESYFIRELYIPNAMELNSSAGDELSLYIDDKARQCLKHALGYTLFNDLDSNVSHGVLDAGAPAKWQNLVNGVEYTLNGNTFKWQGLIYTEGLMKRSLLANYVFYYWLLDQQSQMSGVGEVIVNAKNAVNINSTQRLVRVWNDFVKMYQEGMYQYDYNAYYRDGIRVIDWLGNSTMTDYVSLVKFLEDNDADYPDAALKRYDMINQFGL